MLLFRVYFTLINATLQASMLFYQPNFSDVLFLKLYIFTSTHLFHPHNYSGEPHHVCLCLVLYTKIEFAEKMNYWKSISFCPIPSRKSSALPSPVKVLLNPISRSLVSFTMCMLSQPPFVFESRW